jgi:hypothetical protein
MHPYVRYFLSITCNCECRDAFLSSRLLREAHEKVSGMILVCKALLDIFVKYW